MSADKIELMIKIISWCISGIAGIFAIVAGIKGGKWKYLFHRINAVNTHTEILCGLIEEAEKNENYTGDEKMSYVLSRFMKYCLENKLEYNEDYIKAQIEQLVELTNTVNTKKEKNNGLRY